MALFTCTRVQDPRSASVASITPKNWHKFPPRIAGSNPVNIPVITYVGGTPNLGAAGPDYEPGTARSTDAVVPYVHQGAKATALGKIIAPDVGKSYGGDGAQRGSIEPFQHYPVAAGKPTSSDIPNAFRPSQIPPTVIP